MVEKTYAYETNENNETILAKMREDVKELRVKVKEERRVRLSNAINNRVYRNEEIKRIQVKLGIIKQEITRYNRSGIKEKTRTDILGSIYNLVKNDVGVGMVDMGSPTI